MGDSTVMVASIAALPGMLMSMATYAVGHRNGRNSFINAVQDAAKEVINELRKDKAELKGDLEKAKEMHEKCELGHTECKRDLAEVREEIAKLMSGPVATYNPGGGG